MMGYDDELIRDFLGEMEDAREAIDASVTLLRQLPGDPDQLNSLFRTIHSVKSNLRMMHLDRYSDVVHHAENILEQVRAGQRRWHPLFCDLFSLTIEEGAALTRQTFASDKINELRCHELEQLFDQLVAAPPEGEEGAIRLLIAEMDPGFFAGDELELPAGSADETSTAGLSGAAELASRLPIVGGLRVPAAWMNQLIRAADEQMTERAAERAVLASALVEERAVPIDREQLVLACQLLDFALQLDQGLIGLQFMNSTPADPLLLRHPLIAATLIEGFGGWQLAARGVAEHHEWFDGSGYPAGLAGDEISDIARVVAIVDFYCWRVQEEERAGVSGKRRVLAALTAVNREVGSRFDPAWVDGFNRVIREVYAR